MFYTVKQVAEYLRLSESTILNLIREGEIKAVKLGKRIYRIHSSTLEEIADSHLVSGVEI